MQRFCKSVVSDYILYSLVFFFDCDQIYDGLAAHHSMASSEQLKMFIF